MLQLHWDLERHGYAHLVVHTASNTTCHEVRPVCTPSGEHGWRADETLKAACARGPLLAQLHKYRNVSCVWDASPSVKGEASGRC